MFVRTRLVGTDSGYFGSLLFSRPWRWRSHSLDDLIYEQLLNGDADQLPTPLQKPGTGDENGVAAVARAAEPDAVYRISKKSAK